MLKKPIQYSDIEEWYEKTNTVINNYSNGLSSITLSKSKFDYTNNEDLNILYNKFNEFKNDYYLGTKPEFYSEYSIIADGEIMIETQINSIIDTVNNFEQIICKNTYGNNNTCSEVPGQNQKNANCNYSACSANGYYYPHGTYECKYGSVPCEHTGCTNDMQACQKNVVDCTQGSCPKGCSPNETSCSNGGCNQSYNSKTTNSDTIKVDITCNKKN